MKVHKYTYTLNDTRYFILLGNDEVGKFQDRYGVGLTKIIESLPECDDAFENDSLVISDEKCKKCEYYYQCPYIEGGWK